MTKPKEGDKTDERCFLGVVARLLGVRMLRWTGAFLALFAANQATAVCLDAPRAVGLRSSGLSGLETPAYHVIRGGASNLKTWWSDTSLLVEEVEDEALDAEHEDIPLSGFASAFEFFAARRPPVVSFGNKEHRNALAAWSKATEWR